MDKTASSSATAAVSIDIITPIISTKAGLSMVGFLILIFAFPLNN